MKLKLLIAVLAASFSLSSFAGLLIDPYVGMGTYKTTFDLGNTESDDSGSQTSFGSRLGYSFLLLSAGVDYEMSTVSGDDNDLNITNTSLFVGVDLPILFRFWAEYFLSSSFEVDDSNVDYDFKDGYGLGIGFTGLPFVSLNLEIQNVNYEYEVSTVKGDLASAATIFSVSLPIDL
jgi:hypothetical protein